MQAGWHADDGNRAQGAVQYVPKSNKTEVVAVTLLVDFMDQDGDHAQERITLYGAEVDRNTEPVRAMPEVVFWRDERPVEADDDHVRCSVAEPSHHGSQNFAGG